MLTIPSVSTEQIDDFNKNGFLVIRNAFNDDDMIRIKSWTSELENTPEESGKQWLYHEKSKLNPETQLINRIEKISPFHDGFAELSKVLAKPTATLLDEEAVLFKEKINFKMPGGDGFKPHQDSQAGWEDYARYFISVMVCIDEATIENGCLQMVSGFQQKGLYREWEPLTDEDMADMEFIHCPTKPGDIVFFDCYTPHASEPNMSNKIRRLYFATYNKLSEGDHLEKYYADKYKTFPPDIDRIEGKEYIFRV
ncbi:MAG: phytanoyl-CoA dioxygenase family protein [Proteobacteria bacterium]|nr:phytanoyl-CoA dioxygenase family protein [Pseudomonadota bacterium]NOG59335.1 phytanoyl-CoA dioxygenase family protein [Pseudomonadota bacterium]